MIRLGPITIMRTSERDAYRVLANAAYGLHQTIWYSGEIMDQEAVRALDRVLSDALSRVPASDIDTVE